MAGTSINCLAIVLKELGWSYTRLIAELRRQAAIDGIVLPKTESLIRLILAPEEVRYNPIASELVMVLLKRERRAATPGLRDLSARIGVVA
jgi:hypothetical protein